MVASMAMEMIQREMPTPSRACRVMSGITSHIRAFCTTTASHVENSCRLAASHVESFRMKTPKKIETTNAENALLEGPVLGRQKSAKRQGSKAAGLCEATSP